MRFVLASGVFGLALVGCKGGDDTDVTDTDVTDTDGGSDTDVDSDSDTDSDTDTDPAPDPARVRVIHASADAPAVDVYLKGGSAPVISGLAYGSASGWLEVPPGTYAFDVRAAGADPTGAPVYTTPDVTLPEGVTASAVAAGSLAATGDAAFRVLPVVEGYGDAGDGNIRAILVHASPTAPEVGLDVGNDGSAELSLDTWASTAAEGVALPAAPFGLAIWAGDSKVTQFSVPGLPAGSDVLVAAVGDVAKRPGDKDGFALLAVFPDGATAWIRQDPQFAVLHAGADAPAVDVFAGPTQLIDGLAFGQLSDGLQVPPGTYDLDLFVASPGSTRPEGAPAFTVAGVSLAAGDRVLAVAHGLLAPKGDEGAFTVAALADGFAADLDGARVVAVHGAGDAPPVDVGPSAKCRLSSVAFADVAFGEQSDPAGIALPAGSYTLGVAAAGSASSLVEFPVAVGAGTRLWAIAAGAFAGGEGRAPFQILAVDASAWPYAVAAVPVAGCAT